MSRHAHDGPPVSLRAAVLTVSTTRTLETDTSGALLAERLVGAGHQLVDRRLVVDDPVAIGAILDRWIADPKVQVVLTTGGTGISARDCTAAVVRARLSRELPGFGELFRMLSWEEVGSAAMLSDAVGGLAGNTAVFALPGSSAACRLGIERLILPELGHLARELVKESPWSPSPGPQVTVDPPAAAEPPGASSPAAAPPPPGWPAAIAALGLELGPIRPVAVPEDLPAAVRDVLGAAGECRFGADGSRVYGFPDAHRPGARMLQLLPDGGIRALHRWPRRVGTAPDEGLAEAVQARGLPEPPGGTLFATDSRAIYLLDGETVSRWDGTLRPLGRAAQVLASLVLEWSQR